MTSKAINQIDTEKLTEQEQQGEEYALFLIEEQKKIENGETVTTQWAWQEAIVNWLKEKALGYIVSTLKKLVIEKAVGLSRWLLENLEEKIVELYNNASLEERELFKNKLREGFPDSELLKKLESF